MTFNKSRHSTTAALICSMVFLAACSSDDNGTESSEENGNGSSLSSSGTIEYAYTFTRSDDDTSGQIERINITDGYIVDGTYPSTTSDYSLAGNDEALYQIGRSETDNLTRFSASDTSVIDYQLSLLQDDETETTSPASLVFFDGNLAYLTRNSSDSLLTLDPSPEELTTESLITGEISLEAYNKTTDGVVDYPDMTDAVLLNNKLFVLMQNLDSMESTQTNPAYIAVINTFTNLEIDTETGLAPALRGIQLETVNPTGLQYNESTGQLYVIGRGNYYDPAEPDDSFYSGGVEAIDPGTYQTTLLVDDGDAESNNGFFNAGIVISATLGYVITLDGYDDDGSANNTLRTFNPSTGEVSEPIAGVPRKDLITLALGSDNHVWVGVIGDTPGFIRINADTGELADEQVVTNLIPTDIIFIEVEN